MFYHLMQNYLFFLWLAICCNIYMVNRHETFHQFWSIFLEISCWCDIFRLLSIFIWSPFTIGAKSKLSYQSKLPKSSMKETHRCRFFTPSMKDHSFSNFTSLSMSPQLFFYDFTQFSYNKKTFSIWSQWNCLGRRTQLVNKKIILERLRKVDVIRNDKRNV